MPHLSARDDESQTVTLRPSVYIPIIVIVLVLITVLLVAYLRQRARVARNTQNAPTDVAQRNATTQTPTQSRRQRRRRRPSQVSVTSLPLYMEEAGDTELVLVRGERDMEDNEMALGDTTQRTHDYQDRPSLRELSIHEPVNVVTSDQSMASSSDTESLRRPSISESLNDQSTIYNGANNRFNRVPSTHLPDIPSYSEALQDSSHSILLPHQPEHAALQNLDEAERRPVGTSRPLARNDSTSQSRRLQVPNGLRAFFHRNPSHPPQASQSGLSRSLSQTRLLGHERSTSMNSTASSLHLSRSTSRLSHAENPSMLSLPSISLPLAHTLTRTEISFPPSGPTPEQMKFLGSRESLVRGDLRVPWGDAAVRWATAPLPDWSKSTTDLDGMSEEEVLERYQNQSQGDLSIDTDHDTPAPHQIPLPESAVDEFPHIDTLPIIPPPSPKPGEPNPLLNTPESSIRIHLQSPTDE